jgi:hypothetical protein
MQEIIEMLPLPIDILDFLISTVTHFCQRITDKSLLTALPPGFIRNGQIGLMLLTFGLQHLPTRFGDFRTSYRLEAIKDDETPACFLISSLDSPLGIIWNLGIYSLNPLQTSTRQSLMHTFDTTQPFLPWEIIDEILILLGDPKVAISFQRFAIIRRIDPSYDHNWAIKGGFLNYLKYLNNKHQCIGEYDLKSIRYCATVGDLKVLQYCHENINPITENSDLLDRAAWFGHVDLVKYLHSIGSKCTTDAMDGAAEEGHLEIVKFLHENRKEGCTNYAMDRAALWGLLKVVEWLHLNRTEGCSAKAMEYAHRHNHTAIVNWFRVNRKEAQIYFDKRMLENVEILRLSNCSITIGKDVLKVFWIVLE